MPLETNPAPQSLISSVCNTNMADARTCEVAIMFFKNFFSGTAQSREKNRLPIAELSVLT